MIWMAKKCGKIISESNFSLPATKPPILILLAIQLEHQAIARQLRDP